MFQDFAAAAAFVREHGIRMIDLKFSDLWGRWHHVTLSASEFSPRLMEAGVGFDGSSVGLRSVKSGDMALIPDLSTGSLDPFWDVAHPQLHLLHGGGRQQAALLPRPARHCTRAPRNTCRTPASRTKAAGGRSSSSTSSTRFPSRTASMSPATVWTRSRRTGTAARAATATTCPLHGGYHAIPPRDQLHNVRTRIVTTLEGMGVPVKYHHHEVGGPGQCEIETPLMGLLPAADASQTIKYVAKMVARQTGQTVTFMPKPLYGEAGNGMHFHQHLFKGGANQFYDPQGYSLLSQTALHYIGGLLTHAPALLAFTNPSTNSYRRLVPGFEAPVNCFFSNGNRSAAIRVPAYATEPDKVRLEYRPPDATCNPYLAMAAMLMAGLDGVRRQIDPTAAGFGPIDQNIFDWTPERRATIKALPTSLKEAWTRCRPTTRFSWKAACSRRS